MENDELNLYEMKPEDFFDSDYFLIYKEHHKDILDRLIRLDTSITILEKIAKFNFDLFLNLSQKSFWHMGYWNFKDISIIIICGLVTDTGNDTHTLTKFKNEIFKNLKPESKMSFQENIIKFDDEFNDISEKAKNIRNQFLAHRLFKKNTQELNNDAEGITVSELRKLFHQIYKLFQICSFGSKYCTVLIDFMDTTVGGPTQSHLDDIFDLIIKNSYFINEPEKNSTAWKYLREKMKPEEIDMLNNYRKKFEMPEV